MYVCTIMVRYILQKFPCSTSQSISLSLPDMLSSQIAFYRPLYKQKYVYVLVLGESVWLLSLCNLKFIMLFCESVIHCLLFGEQYSITCLIILNFFSFKVVYQTEILQPALQMSVIARDGPGRSWEPGTQSGSPTWGKGPMQLSHHLLPSRWTFREVWIGSRGVRS